MINEICVLCRPMECLFVTAREPMKFTTGATNKTPIGQEKFHILSTNRRRHSIANGIGMVEHINLHIITYEEFVGKRPLKMQVVFLIDVVIATENAVLHEHTIEIIESSVCLDNITDYKSQNFNFYHKQRRKQCHNNRPTLVLSTLSYEPLRLPFVIASFNVARLQIGMLN
ncbi:hypothetical protein T4B_10321 [Trichinella pseudospiralis]|uniref:Uncharacterized protein n=1 Tax=Trichinella pseudospiralis TaxID=6337 RepID=A0A0V1H092_TRIPS|nr:hypothetical protein T4B_10321 [Trichinella pseudospiralis]